MIRSKVLLAFLLIGCSALAHAAAEVKEYKLDNGMRILVKTDHRAPVVVSQVWYKVGSGYEPSGLTGVSHVLEHMMFKGTKTRGPNEFSRIVAANGGQENAFTSRDYTAYYQQLEKSRLPISFQLESDRMRNLILDPKEFKKELQVVIEERRLRTEDDPTAKVAEQFNAVAYINSPYHHPVIGWLDDLNNLKVEDLKHWYERWYAPNNATLVVVGDVEPDAVYALAKKYFAPLKPSVISEPKPRREIEQRGTRRITVKVPAELPMMIMGYPVPAVNNAEIGWEPYALEVLAAILDGGDSSRFSKNLIRDKQIAASLNTGYDLYPKYQSQFSFSGTPTPNHTVAELEQAIHDELTKLQTEPPKEDELARVKAQVVANNVYERDSVFYQAMQLGSLVSAGYDWKLHDQYVDKVKAVTAEQVQAVAKKYFDADHLTVAELQPLPNTGAPPHGGMPQSNMLR